MGDRLLAIGVDGARGGWLAAAAYGRKPALRPRAGLVPARTELHFFEGTHGQGGLDALAAWRLEEPGGEDAPVAIDVPIGLPPLGGSRPCDYECRARLPGKSSSVFPVPARFLVEQFAHASVTKEQLRQAITDRRVAEQAAGRDPALVAGISSQSCAIFDKVWEADRFVRRDRRNDGTSPAEDWVYEVHPELCFTSMAQATTPAEGGSPLSLLGGARALAGKKTARGQLQRLALVRNSFADGESRIEAHEWSVSGNLDDGLDAYAALWTALRLAAGGVANVEVLTGVSSNASEATVPRDEAGLKMQMVV